MDPLSRESTVYLIVGEEKVQEKSTLDTSERSTISDRKKISQFKTIEWCGLSQKTMDNYFLSGTLAKCDVIVNIIFRECGRISEEHSKEIWKLYPKVQSITIIGNDITNDVMKLFVECYKNSLLYLWIEKCENLNSFEVFIKPKNPGPKLKGFIADTKLFSINDAEYIYRHNPDLFAVYEKIAKDGTKGASWAKYMLYYAHRNGIILSTEVKVNKNESIAIQLLHEYAEKDKEPWAMYELALYYFDLLKSISSIGNLDFLNPEKYKAIAEKDKTPISQYIVGLICPDEQQKWFQMSADQGLQEAKYELDLLKTVPKGEKSTGRLAIEWMIKAAINEDPRAHIFLKQQFSDLNVDWKNKVQLSNLFEYLNTTNRSLSIRSTQPVNFGFHLLQMYSNQLKESYSFQSDIFSVVKDWVNNEIKNEMDKNPLLAMQLAFMNYYKKNLLSDDKNIPVDTKKVSSSSALVVRKVEQKVSNTTSTIAPVKRNKDIMLEKVQEGDANTLYAFIIVTTTCDEIIDYDKASDYYNRLINKATNREDKWACYYIALCLLNGMGVEANAIEAVKWLKKACPETKERHSQSEYTLALCLAYGIGVVKDEELAHEYIKNAVNQGNPNAQYTLGMWYKKGLFGRDKNLSRASNLFLDAEKQGHIKARYECAKLKEENNIEEAKTYFLKAKEIDKMNEQYELGHHFLRLADKGEMISNATNDLILYGNRAVARKDWKKAIEWYSKAINNSNSTEAIEALDSIFDDFSKEENDFYLGICHAEGIYFNEINNGKIERKTLIEKNIEKAEKTLLYLVNKGNIKAKIHFGWGLLLEKEKNKHKQAFDYFSEAKNDGDIEGIYGVACCYLSGLGVGKNVESGLKLLHSIENNKHCGALFSLGMCYFKAIGTISINPDYKKGFEYFRLAAEEGNLFAIRWVAFCYERGIGAPHSLDEAIKWYLKAAFLCNDGESQYGLGMCYLSKGKVEEGLDWIVKASENNNPQAKDFLSRTRANCCVLKELKENDQQNDQQISDISNSDTIDKVYQTVETTKDYVKSAKKVIEDPKKYLLEAKKKGTDLIWDYMTKDDWVQKMVQDKVDSLKLMAKEKVNEKIQELKKDSWTCWIIFGLAGY